MAKSRSAKAAPIASRPDMPSYGLLPAEGGAGLLSWRWALDRLQKSHNYFLSTTRPDGRPHCMPVWGVWADDVFYFSTAPDSVKARNLERNPNCVITTEDASQAIIVEGVAEVFDDRKALSKLLKIYEDKYNFEMSADMGPYFAVYPTRAYGIIEYAMQGSATRWTFAKRRK
jgi:PPOX class probable F420-dependent enzyme